MPLISSDYIQNSQLVVDVGGTNIDIYSKTQNNLYSLIDSIKTPDSASELYIILNTIFEKYGPSFPILGLPGPVQDKSSSVFCPPLNYSLDLSLIHDKYPNLLILNDTECLSYIIFYKDFRAISLHGGSLESINGLICTIGTSFGLASFNYFHEVGALLVESFEIAHIPLILTSRFSRALDHSPFFKTEHSLSKQYYSQVLSGVGFKKLTSCPEFPLLMAKLYPDISKISNTEAYSLLICELLVSICQFFAPRSSSFILHGGVLNALDKNKLSTLFQHVFTFNNFKNVRLNYSAI